MLTDLILKYFIPCVPRSLLNTSLTTTGFSFISLGIAEITSDYNQSKDIQYKHKILLIKKN